MSILLALLQIAFGLMALFVCLSFADSKKWDELLAAVLYGGAAGTSFAANSGWPLIFGFGLVWLLRVLGIEERTNS